MRRLCRGFRSSVPSATLGSWLMTVFRPWSRLEEKQLEILAGGVHHEQIALMLGRTPRAVVSKMSRMKIKGIPPSSRRTEQSASTKELVLKHAGKMPHRDIAHVLGISVDGVKHHLRGRSTGRHWGGLRKAWFYGDKPVRWTDAEHERLLEVMRERHEKRCRTVSRQTEPG